MRKAIYYMLCSLLLSTGWINAFAQGSSTTPAERLKLSVVDNRSVFDIDNQENTYTNTLRLSQPGIDNPYKLTAGMLNEGDNYITIHRLDNTGGDVECLRVNLNTEVIEQESEVIDMIDFYGDGSNAPSSNTAISANELAGTCWGTNGSNLIWQTSGYAYVTGATGLTFTVPDGYSNASIEFVIYVGSNARGGLFAYNVNGNTSWTPAATATAGGTAAFIVGGLNTGDVVGFWGVNSAQTSLYDSPDIQLIGALSYPSTIVPDLQITPTVSTCDGSAWGSETSLGNAITLTPNDTINLYGLGNLNDIFSVSTVTNNHPDSYSYKADLDANIVLPVSGTGSDFTATADFTAAASSNPASAAFTGPGNWEFLGAAVYTPDAGRCCYINSYGTILYVLPDDFMGNSVSVSVTTSTGTDGAGDLLVNGVSHTFTAGETYTWTVPVTANGTIEFKAAASATYSPDFTLITISSGNGAKFNSLRPSVKSLEKSLKPGNALGISNSKGMRDIKLIND